MDNAECPLAELVDDPLIGPVMKSDGVDRRELELLLEQVARAIADDPARRLTRSRVSRWESPMVHHPPYSMRGTESQCVA